MRSLFLLSAGLLVAWLGGEALALHLHDWTGGDWQLSLWASRLLAFFGGVVFAQCLFGLRGKLAAGGNGDGLRTALRPVTGMAVRFLVEGLEVLGCLFVLALLAVAFVPMPNGAMPDWVAVAMWLLVLPLLWLVFDRNGIRQWHYRFLGKLTAPFRRLWRVYQFGRGGSATFAGITDEWESLHKPGSILLGRSAYGKEWTIGLKDDRHLLTIASTGGGKGRSAIIPNLVLWPGSALVLDPKGTNAAVTAARRGNGSGRVKQGMGQEVHVFDPFRVLAKQGIETGSFNPLALLDPSSERIAEDIWSIADALVVAEPGAEHWDQSAHSLISGLIAHVITQEPEEKRNLAHVRDLLTGTGYVENTKYDDEVVDVSIFGRMSRNPGAAGLAARAAAQLMAAGDRERGSILSCAMRHTRWLDSIPMRGGLSGGGFDLRDLKRKPMTVYVVIPPEELENHKRFLRLFVTLGLAAMTREPGKPKHRVLFLMDEFPALGPLESVRVGINVIRSYGVMLWPIIQNIGQLAHLYGKDAQTFLDATGAVQVFSVGGHETAAFIASNLGERPVDRNENGQVVRVMTALRTAGEIQEETDRDWGTQIILRAGKPPLLLKRVIYDKAFPKSQFMPDPDHPEK